VSKTGETRYTELTLRLMDRVHHIAREAEEIGDREGIGPQVSWLSLGGVETGAVREVHHEGEGQPTEVERQGRRGQTACRAPAFVRGLRLGIE
jgi:hypothetical protein